MLFDRLEIIKVTNQKYDLESNAYLSFSGGKDSTILHYLIDMALPSNRIPRVFINTGIEYNDITAFVKELASRDNRFVIIQPTRPVKQMLNECGYPFKSKQHSQNLGIYQNSGIGLSIKRYLGLIESNTLFRCPKLLSYQFDEKFSIKISDKCCLKLKKEPIHKWKKENNKPIAILGLRIDEGGQRASHKGCVVTKGNSLVKFKPLNPITDAWEDWFINQYNIQLCRLYYPPFNFKRTGCKGCPYSLDLSEQLKTMELYLPNERRQCEFIWQPVYDEYRRIGYRLRKQEE